MKDWKGTALLKHRAGDRAELQKNHKHARIACGEGLQNGQSARKVSCQHSTLMYYNEFNI